MKIGLIADPHYSSDERIGNRYPRRSLDKIYSAAKAFKSANVDLILCLGDMINDEAGHNEENLRLISEPLVSVTECLLVQGNHDRELFTAEQLAKRTGMTAAPCSFVRGRIRIIALDGNFCSDGSPYRLHETDWTDTFLPGDQLAMLRSSLAESSEDTYIFIHQCLDPHAEAHHIVRNAAEVRAIIAESGKVKGVYQGHYHPGLESTVDCIPYHTLPAMCENGLWYVIDL
ncbi:MAG: metallophosphoesterase family protein [Eubacteriales bacterium]